MDNSTVITFSSRTAQDIIENLEKSLQILIVLKEGSAASATYSTTTTTATPTTGGEGVKKFESLCRGIVSSVQELSLRIAKLSETDKEIRPIAAECRKILLEVSTSLMLATSSSAPNGPKSPGHIKRNTFPALVESTLPLLINGCRSALLAAEQMNGKKIREMGDPVLQTLSHLQKCGPNSEDLFLSVKLFGIRLLKFLETCSARHRDLVDEGLQNSVVAQAETVKKLAPYLIQTLRDSIQRPGNCQLRDCKDFFFNSARKSVESLIHMFEKRADEPGEELEPAGGFVKRMDSILEELKVIDTDFSVSNIEKVRKSSEWLVRFALSVSKACPRDESDIFDTCRNVVSELESLKTSHRHGTSLLRDALEGAEHAVNVALLRLIVSTFSRSHLPLDLLIQEVVTTTVVNTISRHSQLPAEMDALIQAVDDHNDDLFHAAHFSRYCATDKTKSLDILSRLRTLEILEKEMVPTCLRLYYNAKDSGAKSYLRTVRNFWKSEFDALETSILDIVDATALCAVIDEEVRTTASEIKKRTYAQDGEWLRMSVSKLVKMCQMGVDAAWKEAAGGDSKKQLPDEHPVIKMERSTWEVRSALSVVLNSVENLNAHKALVRRVQLLATSMSNVVKFLISVNDDEEEDEVDEWRSCDESRTGPVTVSVERSSSVRVLTSVSRITIGSPIASEISRRKMMKSVPKRTTGEVSRVGTRSFRLNNATSREPRRLVSTTARNVDETMKILSTLTPKLPFSTRKANSVLHDNVTEPKLEIAKDFDLSNILNSPRPPPEGRENPVKAVSSFTPTSFSSHTRSPLKVITNSSKSFPSKNLGMTEFTKFGISNSTSVNIGSPELFSDLEMIDKRIDLLLMTS